MAVAGAPAFIQRSTAMCRCTRSTIGRTLCRASAKSTWWRMAARRSRAHSIRLWTMVDVATGWTECLPLVTREGALVIEAIKRAQSLFPWLLRGVDFDNDSAFMNEVVVPWCRKQKLEVTRSRAYKKNDQAFVEQKNTAPSCAGWSATLVLRVLNRHG